MSKNEKHTNYFGVYVTLVVAFVISMILGELGSSVAITASIFLIAAFKAYLVLMKFMHVSSEPRIVQWLVGSLFMTLGLVFIGIVTDVAFPFGG